MKNIIIMAIVGVLVFALIFGIADFDGIGKTTGETTEQTGGANEPEVKLEEPDIVVPEPKVTCANLRCKEGYSCTYERNNAVCVQDEELQPAPPSDTLLGLVAKGNYIVEGISWDCGVGGNIACVNPKREPGDRIQTYGYVIVPEAGEYVIETGFRPLYTTASWIPFVSYGSACDDSPYYSGVKKYLKAGQKYYFEFNVKLPETAGTYSQYAEVWSGCGAEGGERLGGDSRVKKVGRVWWQ